MHGSNLKIQVLDSIRYPDACVTCTPLSPDATQASSPVVIFEILSPGTARTDRMVKNREYAAAASVQRYVMLEQEAVEATIFVRTAPDAWVGHILGSAATLDMPEIGVSLPLAALYAGIDLTPG